MAATIIEREQPSDQLEAELKDTQAQKAAEDAVPDKYKGKTVAEVVKMHQEAESTIGRQGHELGQLRSVTDSFIKRQLDSDKAAAQASTPTKQDDTEFFTDPQAAVRKVVQEAIKPLQETNEQAARREGMSRLLTKFPDAHEVAKTEDFQKWVMASRVRQQLFAQADKFDFDAAEELVSTFKALNPTKTVAAATETPAQAKPSNGKTIIKGMVPSQDDGDGKKIYRRADIIRLMQTDPKRYLELEPEIRQAYVDKRVR